MDFGGPGDHIGERFFMQGIRREFRERTFENVYLYHESVRQTWRRRRYLGAAGYSRKLF